VTQSSDNVVPAADGLEIRRVGTFDLLEEIGRGGMGIVYRARDLKLQRVVALKRPKPDLLERPDLRRRFMTEARSASKLMHPHITTVFEVFEEDGVPWLVMELIEGASLRSMLSDGDPLPYEDVLRHAEGLTDGLRAAHVGGILHRDINPNNVLIGTDGRARLNDFGLARAWAAPADSPEISEDSTEVYTEDRVAGTRGYMSPEQALGKPVDPRSDIFSLGVILFEMATGRRPFLGSTNIQVAAAILRESPPLIEEIRADLPHHLSRIVGRCLRKDPKRRWQGARDLCNDLEDLAQEMAAGRTSHTVEETSPSVAVLPFLDNTLGAIAFGLVLAFFVGLVIIGGIKRIGDHVNIETDMIGKYVERFVMRSGSEENENVPGKSGIDMDFLAKTGFI